MARPTVRQLRSAFSILRMREFAAIPRTCPFCGWSVIVRLCADETGVRCIRCGASTVHLSLGWALRRQVGDLRALDICELSARGPLALYLRRHARSTAFSEYFADRAPGEIRDGIRCEDVQQLTYAGASFDVVTHTEVLEHVPDDARALSELRRVLKPGGLMLFTVPLHGGAITTEHARLQDGVIEYLHTPVYHNDPLRGTRILAFRDYGDDIVDRVLAAGFARAWIQPALVSDLPWGYGRGVVCAAR